MSWAVGKNSLVLIWLDKRWPSADFTMKLDFERTNLLTAHNNAEWSYQASASQYVFWLTSRIIWSQYRLQRLAVTPVHELPSVLRHTYYVDLLTQSRCVLFDKGTSQGRAFTILCFTSVCGLRGINPSNVRIPLVNILQIIRKWHAN